MPATPPTKRDQMVTATVSLLRASGLTGASLNRALAQSGAPKGSLYHYFPGGKDELVTAALVQFSDDFAHLLATHFSGERPFPVRWTALLQAMGRGLKRDDFQLGCPLAATLLGLEPDERVIRKAITAAFERWIDLLVGGLPDLPPGRRRPFAESLLGTLEGALLMARVLKSDAPLRNARDFGIAAHGAK